MSQLSTDKAYFDFQSLFKATPDPYLILSPQLNIIEVNEAYLRATMVKREEILGRPLFDVFPDNPEEPEATGARNLRASLMRVLEQKRPDAMAVQKYDIRRPAAEGGGFEERYWSPINTPVLSKDQEVCCIIHRVVDVTDFMRLKLEGKSQKEKADKIDAHVMKIEAELIQRARELQEANEQLRALNEELRKKEGDLKSANEELEAFSYSVSHDLRNPIQAISGFSALLLEYARLNEEEKDYLNEVIKAARGMNELIGDLLSFSQSTRCEMRREVVNLSALVEEVIGELQKQDPDRKIHWKVKKNVEAFCDPHLMKITFQNLLQNAWKFTAKTAQPEIEFGAEEGEKPVYYIRDNGAGFPPEKSDRLFQPFSRLHPAKDFMGAGVGLATVKRIVERHQGHVWAEGEVGRGATFFLRF